VKILIKTEKLWLSGVWMCMAWFLNLILSGSAMAQTPVPSAGARSVPPVASPAPRGASAAATQSRDGAEDPNAIRVLLSPELETTLVAQMVGRISSLPVQLGGRVARGKVLVAFDCSEANARLGMAQAEFVSAKETFDAKSGLRKLEAAGDTEVALAAAAVDRAKAAIALSRAQLAQCAVSAPFAGRIAKIHVKPYQGVNIGAPLVDLISDGPLKLRLNVPSRWLREIRPGIPFEVAINETGRSYPARVTLVNARVDAVAQTIELEARMDRAEPELLAGMSGIARFQVKSP